jgi:hypothetical protein
VTLTQDWIQLTQAERREAHEHACRRKHSRSMSKRSIVRRAKHKCKQNQWFLSEVLWQTVAFDGEAATAGLRYSAATRRTRH